ncbi:MAG: OadG family protein [Spirochaetaceae bacterium]|jgi:oxaloacetate decarboxylase gamma subunit|nr:OadG family protein [Spirochaetaceae bacterium]
MTILDMLGQSATMTGLGMAVVFSFLVIMILALTLVHRLVDAFKGNAESRGAPAVQAAPAQAVPARQDTARIVAAIAAALQSKNM